MLERVKGLLRRVEQHTDCLQALQSEAECVVETVTKALA